MKCPRCPQENPVGAQFCGQCGAQLDMLCFACQAFNPPENGFCHRCGQRLTTAAGPVLTPMVGVTRDEPSVARSGDGTERCVSTVRQRLEAEEMPDQDQEPDDVGSLGARAKPAPAGSTAQRTPHSSLFQERVCPEDLAEEQPLERVRDFKRKGAARLTTSLIVAGLTGPAVVMVASSAPVKMLVSRVRSEALLISANPAIIQPSGLPEASSSVRAEELPMDATGEPPATGLQEPTLSVPARIATTTVTGRAPKARGSARGVPNPRAPAPPRPTASVLTSPVASALSPPDLVDIRITAPRSLRPDEPDSLAIIDWLLQERR